MTFQGVEEGFGILDIQALIPLKVGIMSYLCPFPPRKSNMVPSIYWTLGKCMVNV